MMRFALATTGALAVAGLASAEVGRLKIVSPADATVVINDIVSQSKTGVRVIASQDLEPGVKYWYAVEARVLRNGQWYTERNTVSIRAGYQTTLTFDFSPAELAKRQLEGAGNSTKTSKFDLPNETVK